MIVVTVTGALTDTYQQCFSDGGGGHPPVVPTPHWKGARRVSAIDEELEVPQAIFTWTRKTGREQKIVILRGNTKDDTAPFQS